jgi:prepilin-type N-terminal cleavage/methylation domain-containing protein
VLKQVRPPKSERERAFTLIEMIAVLTVVAILALALATVTIRYLDRVAAEKETAQLKSLAEGFRQSVITTKIITNQTGWDYVIATALGMQVNQVRTNDRRVARAFLIDPNLQVRVNGGTLPYAQDISPPGSAVTNASGNVIPPISPRVMIVSSLSKPLPVTNGVASSAAAFSNIWNAAEGTIPAGWTWTGKGEDLKIQRIHLADLFVQAVFNNQDPDNEMQFRIDGVPDAVFPTNSVSRFFLDGTLLTLYGTNGLVDHGTNVLVLQHTEILHESKSFVSERGSWTTGGYFGVTIHHPTALDLQMAADATLALTTNNPAATYIPSDVYDAMVNYMASYVDWAGSGFNNLFLPALTDAQSDLAAKSKDLVSKQH